MIKIAIPAFLILAGCCAPVEEEQPEAPYCWLTGTTTEHPRLRCFDTFAECTEDAYRWGGAEGVCE